MNKCGLPMPTDLKQRIASMKEAAEKAQDAPAYSVADCIFVKKANPAAVLALIDEIERLERENKLLRDAAKDADGDTRSAATEARWQASQGEDYGSY